MTEKDIYDKRKFYKTKLEPLIHELKLQCNMEHMPMFVTVAVKNDKAGTEYASDMVLAGSGTELENNRISKLLLELNNIHQKYPDYIEKDIREISQYLERLNTNIYPNSGIELADNKINTFHKITDPYKPSSCEPDGTYQKYTPESTGSSSSESKLSNGKGIWGKILNFVENFLDIVVIIAIALILLLVLVLIVTAVKLRHRDLELDDLYDEYGIDLDEEEEALKAKKKEEKQEKKAKKASKQVSKKASKKYDDENEFEGYDEDDLWVTENIAKAMEKPKKQKSVKHATAKKAAAKGVRSLDETGPAIRKPVKNINLQDTDDFEKFTPLDEEEFDNFEGYYSDDDYDMFGSNDYDYDDDELFDATADLLSNHPEKKRSHAEMDDTFKMDVIDLD